MLKESNLLYQATLNDYINIFDIRCNELIT